MRINKAYCQPVYLQIFPLPFLRLKGNITDSEYVGKFLIANQQGLLPAMFIYKFREQSLLLVF